jgi:polysaccharide pyruvyl transferase WcaK-like protein
MPRALICPPTGRGSLGDEAMIDGLSTRLAAIGYTVGVMTPFQVAQGWTHLPHVSAPVEYPEGGRIKAALGLMRVLPRYERVLVIGADVVDGYYETATVKRMLLITAIAGLVCRDARLVGFSFNSSPSRTSVRLLRMLPPRASVYVRDPHSLERFRAFTQRKAALGADIAFLLSPAQHLGAPAAALDGWMVAHQENGRRVVAFNAGGAIYDPTGSSGRYGEFIAAYARELTALLRARPDVAVAMIAHDHRPFMREHDLLRDICAAAAIDVADRLTVLASAEVTAREVKRLVARCDFVVSSRMHLCVAALGSGIPAGGIPYQDKFTGLFGHFGLDGPFITSEASLVPHALQRFASLGLDAAPDVRGVIADRLPYVLALAEESVGPASSRGRAARHGSGRLRSELVDVANLLLKRVPRESG